MVTGASRGIGAAVCRALLQAGVDVIGVSRAYPPSAVADLSGAAHAHDATFTALECDLSSREQISDVLVPTVRALAPVDVLVHAAGVNRRASVRAFELDDWDAVLSVNLDAGFLLARAFGHDMAERGSGHIVFLASMLSFQGGLMAPAYAASKGAVAQLTKSFANELAALGVNVNAVAPGYIGTDMNAELIADEARHRQITERIPAGRWGTPDEIAEVCLFLTSPAARYIHGAVIPVDGGWLAR